MNDRHEARLLLSILREDWDEAGELVASQPPVDETFLALARKCDVMPWLHYRIRAAERLDLVGTKTRAALFAERDHCRTDNILLLGRLERVIDRLLGIGVTPILLKGTDFIHRYPIPFDARTMDDGDFLVRPAEVARVLALFETDGWKLPPEPERTHWLRSSYEMPLWSPPPAPVLLEVHWSLGQARRYRIRTDDLFARATPLDVGGRSVLALDPHDAAAHLLLHQLQHYFDRRLKWGIDLHLISSGTGFSWDLLRERLAEWGGLTAAAISLRHLRKLFPGWFPSEEAIGLRTAAWRRALTWPLRSGHPIDYFRGTRRRPVQLFLAAAFYERPSRLARYLVHRRIRDRLDSAGPEGPSSGGTGI